MTKSIKETPLMLQYNKIKAKYSDAVLLFRVGDFYETFGADAVRTSQILGIVLTKRANGSAAFIELAGFPHHSLDTYLPKLVRAGLRVAICDQLEDPKSVKGIVKRGVTELITPGVTFNDQVLSSKKNNFLLSFYQEKGIYGYALIDVSTGEFLVGEGNLDSFSHVIDSFSPSEYIGLRYQELPNIIKNKNYFKLDDWAYQETYANDSLLKHFKTQSLKGFGIEHLRLGIIAAGAIFAYLVEDTHHKQLEHITKIQEIPQEDFLKLDAFSLRNLEIIYANQPEGKSLLKIIDHCQTPMGSRLLRRRLVLPIKSPFEINRRLDAVNFYNTQDALKTIIKKQLQNTSDIDRLIGKLAADKISPKELGYLRQSIVAIQCVKEQLKDKAEILKSISALMDAQEVVQILQSNLQEELPVALQKGNVICCGVSEELDHLRLLQSQGKGFLDEMAKKYSQETGISSLKIDFNHVFGYYIEVRHAHKDKVPPEWHRKQTLVNAERYITEELKIYEEQILGAEDKIRELEQQLYKSLCQRVMSYIDLLQWNSKIIAEHDVAIGFSELSIQENYTRPIMNDSYDITINDGRHPIIEKCLAYGESYVPNSVFFNREQQQIIMLTGPNMAGKSALLRQTALICLMAQIGCYVPCKQAELGVLDRIFTRVGASDNISSGESTFMVEMNESAYILNNITDRTLILLDEIGRGTSTYDGVSIAWAIAEYLHIHSTKAKTFFATHYHELNEMTLTFPRIRNYHISIQETKNSILFLRKLTPGGSQHSFGIHVAKLAGMPSPVINRANQILKTLEEMHQKQHHKTTLKKETDENMQLSFFQLDDPLLEDIRDQILKVDIDTLTPIDALLKLNHIKKLLLG